LFLFATATGAPAFTPDLSSTGWAVVAFLGFGGAVISYMLWLWALRNTTPTLVAVTLPMNPLMALLLGGLLLGEEVNTKMIGGFVLVILGVVIANWRRRQVKAS
jgi:drug/metabolite transporter (DMT)-like permease